MLVAIYPFSSKVFIQNIFIFDLFVLSHYMYRGVYTRVSLYSQYYINIISYKLSLFLKLLL